MSVDAPTSGRFNWVPVIHPWIREHEEKRPVKVADQLPPNLNGKIALLLTKAVGTMWCAYAFAALALIALPSAIHSGGYTLIQWVSQTFIQLVMLSVIMVGQNILSQASDKRADDTWKDADATFHTAHRIQDHLSVQDEHLAAQDARLQQIAAALAAAYPTAAKELGISGGEPPATS